MTEIKPRYLGTSSLQLVTVPSTLLLLAAQGVCFTELFNL